MSFKERRSAPRVRVDLEGTISPNGWLKKEVKVENISESGLLIKSQIPIFSLSRVFVSLELDGEPFEGQAICVRVSPKPPWEAGLHFVDMDEKSKQVLKEFINKRLKQDLNENN